MPLLILISVCFAVGGVVDFFSDVNWITAGLVLLAILLVIGLELALEDKQPGGLDFDASESEESKAAWKKSVTIHLFLIVVVIGAALFSAWM